MTAQIQANGSQITPTVGGHSQILLLPDEHITLMSLPENKVCPARDTAFYESRVCDATETTTQWENPTFSRSQYQHPHLSLPHATLRGSIMHRYQSAPAKQQNFSASIK